MVEEVRGGGGGGDGGAGGGGSGGGSGDGGDGGGLRVASLRGAYSRIILGMMGKVKK